MRGSCALSRAMREQVRASGLCGENCGTCTPRLHTSGSGLCGSLATNWATICAGICSSMPIVAVPACDLRSSRALVSFRHVRASTCSSSRQKPTRTCAHMAAAAHASRSARHMRRKKQAIQQEEWIPPAVRLPHAGMPMRWRREGEQGGAGGAAAMPGDFAECAAKG